MKFYLLPLLFLCFLIFGCASKSSKVIKTPAELLDDSEFSSINGSFIDEDPNTITLLFAGDIMAHNVNYNISDYHKIWEDVKDEICSCDLAFANIEAPIDSTKPASSYPNFNMTLKFTEAAIDAGFDIFSLCNNHSNDQGLSGIEETIKSCEILKERSLQRKEEIYFSGLKNGAESSYTYNIVNRNGWKILFLPVTELLNRPDFNDHINYVKTKEKDRLAFIEYCKKLRDENPCDLFILSMHTAEPEYVREIEDSQTQYYKALLDAGVDIVWANHAHIIKDRKIIINSKNQTGKIIMYANGNTISGQRTSPELSSKNPISERDNTGDGLFYKVTLTKDDENLIHIKKCEPIFVTTYITTAYEYVIKTLDQDFIDYLNSVSRQNWSKYIEKRLKINEEYTKDLIEWQ